MRELGKCKSTVDKNCRSQCKCIIVDLPYTALCSCKGEYKDDFLWLESIKYCYKEHYLRCGGGPSSASDNPINLTKKQTVVQVSSLINPVTDISDGFAM